MKFNARPEAPGDKTFLAMSLTNDWRRLRISSLCDGSHCLCQPRHVGWLPEIESIRQDGVPPDGGGIGGTGKHKRNAASLQLQSNRRNPLTTEVDIKNGGIRCRVFHQLKSMIDGACGPQHSKPACGQSVLDFQRDQKFVLDNENT